LGPVSLPASKPSFDGRHSPGGPRRSIESRAIVGRNARQPRSAASPLPREPKPENFAAVGTEKTFILHEAAAFLHMHPEVRARANVTGLTWEQVDLERRLAWVHPDQAKGRKAIGVPLNDTANAILRAEVGKDPERVFAYEGRPVFQVSFKAWYKALKRAGIKDFR
jgi:integrase